MQAPREQDAPFFMALLDKDTLQIAARQCVDRDMTKMCVFVRMAASGIECSLRTHEFAKENLANKHVPGTASWYSSGLSVESKYDQVLESCTNGEVPCVLSCDDKCDVVKMALGTTPTESSGSTYTAVTFPLEACTRKYNDITQTFFIAQDGKTKEVMKSAVFRAYFPGQNLYGRCFRRHGTATVVFHNGDVVVQRWVDGELAGIVMFIPSPHAPAEFAGIAIGAASEWTISNYPMEHGWYDNAYWPDPTSDEGQLFWRYIDEGRIGWSERTKAHARMVHPLAHKYEGESAALEGGCSGENMDVIGSEAGARASAEIELEADDDIPELIERSVDEIEKEL